jgi:hypothetical protein
MWLSRKRRRSHGVCLAEETIMLEKMHRGLSHALRGVRAGYEKIIAEDDAFAQTPDTISLESPAFGDGGDIPEPFTADGERISPPLLWRGAPEDAESLVLIIEDPDAPNAEPLVHLLLGPPARSGVARRRPVSQSAP